jgi:hypothetical protein
MEIRIDNGILLLKDPCTESLELNSVYIWYAKARDWIMSHIHLTNLKITMKKHMCMTINFEIKKERRNVNINMLDNLT